MPHYLQFDSNMMNPSRIRRCMIEPEEIWSKNTKEKELSGNFVGLQKFATCKFRRLPAKFRNTAHLCVDCFLTHIFCGFIQVFPSCNFSSLAHFCNFLILHLYKLSLVCNQINFHSIHQSIKLGTKLPLLVGDFLSLSLIFLHFLGSKTPLDDDKSRDARLKPPHP